MSAPDFLRGRAREKWEELFPLREWAVGDRDLLAAYCAAYGRWIEAEEWLAEEEHGPVLTIHDDKGDVRRHGPAPQLVVGERASKEMARISKVLRLDRLF